MTLLDNIARETGSNRVAGHRIEHAFTLYFHGHVTRTQMINFFSIPVGFESDFDQFLTKYEGFPATNQGMLDQTRWVQDLVGCLGALQLGDIPKSLFNSILGLTLDES